MKGEEERAKVGAEFREVVTGIVEQLVKPNISDFYPSLARFDLQGIQKNTRLMIDKLDRIFERLIEQRSVAGGGDGEGEI